MKSLKIFGLVALASGLWSAAAASAQPIGTYRWQLQPFCNVITVAVVQQGGQYQLHGTDDQCGSAVQASVVGLAFQNANGTIGFGLTVVTAPGGTPVSVDATITIATLGGTWRDSAGNTGTFIFTPGAGVGGGPRPVPSGGLAPGSVTTIQIAPAAVTNTQIAADAVTGASVANGTLTAADLADGPRAAFASGDQSLALTATAAVARSLTMTIPATGRVIVNASGFLLFNDPSAAVTEAGRCSITTGTTIDFTHMIGLSDSQSTDTSQSAAAFGATRGFDVSAGSFTVNLVCDEFAGNIILNDSSLTAIFIAS